MEVDKGEFVFLIGASGSGKSTFMRMLLREEAPSSGEIHVANFHVNKLAARRVPKLRQRIGCVFQDFRLLQQKSVADNVAFALEVIGKPRSTIKKVVPEVLDLVGLAGKSDRLPTELSGGEQQRVAIAGRCCCWPTNRRATSTPTRARTSCCCWSGSTAPEPR